ncbi:hypothetical protein Val02_58420 [Virgisporangium aliadipatigenens]|uniref:Cutinase n=1 Tax=Virgisporangium aliadipatigenens TaxID=741659 RepID=A0A8J4DT82_9ACTN|nr:cutinase family protein [Virgisporangium aliadipatigenens]GIJ48956.1 hypothetical protein Val02_58420 [Virgisporangium aliadipatigenens]
MAGPSRKRILVFAGMVAAVLLVGATVAVASFRDDGRPSTAGPASPGPPSAPVTPSRDPLPSPAASPSASPPASATTPAPAPPAADGACRTAKLFGARGTGEAPGTGGLISTVAFDVHTTIDVPLTIAGVDYPASADITGSVAKGVAEVKRLVAAEPAGSCLILMGYSQGAIVIGDALAALGTADAAKVRAVVLFGDPRFRGSEPYNAGTYAKGTNGVFPRPAGQLSRFNGRIRSYCNGADNVCQSPVGSAGGIHTNYHDSTAPAAAFAVGKI